MMANRPTPALTPALASMADTKRGPTRDDKHERERKRIEKTNTTCSSLHYTHTLNSNSCGCDKILFDTPIADRLKARSHEIDTWTRLVTPTKLSNKLVLLMLICSSANTNHTITDTLSHNDPITAINEHKA
jgi:hypothetical protein